MPWIICKAMFPRLAAERLQNLAREFPAVVILGPRQVGKTTLARTLMAGYPRSQYLNWDVPNDCRIIRDQG